jgi:uncharacterized protein
MRDLEEIQVSLDELEAIRLKDLEGLEQDQGAEKMNISRATFQRILTSARQKIAEALLNGKALRIEGGNFELTGQKFRCRGGHEWVTESTNELPIVCPKCATSEVRPVPPENPGDRGRRGWGRCHRKE